MLVLVLRIRILAGGGGGAAAAVAAVSHQGVDEIKQGLALGEKTAPAYQVTILQQQAEQNERRQKMKTCEVWIVLYRKHEHARALEQSSTSTQA